MTPWRKLIQVHPAADLFPRMTPDELRDLAEDIAKHGLRERVKIWYDDKGVPHVLDGINRLDALELLFREGRQVDGRSGFVASATEYAEVEVGGQKLSTTIFSLLTLLGRGSLHIGKVDDPTEYVISANIRRRHLTIEQRQQVIGRLIKANPLRSDRQTAKVMGIDHKTVASVRTKLERRGEISPRRTCTDTKGRQQPACKLTKATAKSAPPKSSAAPLAATPQAPQAEPTTSAALIASRRNRIFADIARLIEDAKQFPSGRAVIPNDMAVSMDDPPFTIKQLTKLCDFMDDFRSRLKLRQAATARRAEARRKADVDQAADERV
jgi:hypothetical protein